jgi:hypothetical protein
LLILTGYLVLLFASSRLGFDSRFLQIGMCLSAACFANFLPHEGQGTPEYRELLVSAFSSRYLSLLEIENYFIVLKSPVPFKGYSSFPMQTEDDGPFTPIILATTDSPLQSLSKSSSY